MANLMQLINKSKTIEEKAKTIASDLISQYKHGQIKTKQEMLYKSYIALKNFYNSIGKPTMQVRHANGYPSSVDYNNTNKEIYNDLHVMIEESQNLASVLEAAFNNVEIDRQQLDNQYNLALKKLDKAKLKLSDIDAKNVFMDSFINMNYIDKGASTLSPVYIDTNFGYIALATTESNEVNRNAEIVITDDSNGFPGNTHQINIISNDIKYVGEDGLHINLADMLDNKSDTWFEYELYQIDDDTLLKTLNLGYSYEEGRKWISNDNKLRLGITISFTTTELINTISMSPFISPDKDAIPSIIRSIIISNGKGLAKNILDNIDTFDKDKVYSFPKQYCKTITIILEQELSYSTMVGHQYFIELTSKNIDYYKSNEIKLNQRVDGPKPTIENLGMIYDDNDARYIQQPSKYGASIDNEITIKKKLFDLPTTDDYIKAYVESLSANRFHIGIRDITLSNFAYESESEYISKDFIVEEPIEAISLEVDDFIPDEFETILDLDGNIIDWIKYYFSIDSGTTWYSIKPKGTFKHEGFDEYVINAGVPSGLRRNDIGYIEMDDDIYAIKFKAIIERPTELVDSEYYSPIIYEYKLIIN